MSDKEKRYEAVLVSFAKGEATREQVRAADPMRQTIKEASKLAAQSYSASNKRR